MKQSTLIAMLMTALGPGVVASVFAADVWTPALVPSSIQVTESGGFIVYFASQVSSTCGNTVHIYQGYHLVNDSGAKSMLASALAAMNAEKTISVMYDDSTNFCWGRYLTINR